jgi:hypothetical protein
MHPFATTRLRPYKGNEMKCPALKIQTNFKLLIEDTKPEVSKEEN